MDKRLFSQAPMNLRGDLEARAQAASPDLLRRAV
jgi:hypothetical protein